VIAGPTASGKSALALALSRLMPVTIINADASQLYRDLRIVTARPSPEDEAKAPHRLFGVLDGEHAASAADWAKMAKPEIADAHDAGRIPIVVGGTGLYIRTLLDGIAPVPAIDSEIRARVRNLNSTECRALLLEHDPDRAAQLDPNDRTRIARALEVVLSTGKPLAEWQSESTGGIADQHDIHGVILLPPRAWLRARCDTRFESMLAAGGVAEVGALLARGLGPDLPIMKAIGVREIAAILQNPGDHAELAEQAKAATRQFAKRQYTWFRNQLPDDWERIETQLDADSIENIVIKLRRMLLTR
jgi:tRNA dimethylallyltransferase